MEEKGEGIVKETSFFFK